MNKLVRAGLAVGIGFGAPAGMWYAMDNTELGLSTPTVEINAKVMACANALGEVAVKTTNVPGPCKDYTKLGYRDLGVFDFQEKEISAYDHKKDEYKEVSHAKIYSLPTASEFKKERFITPQEDKRNHQLYLRFGAVMGIFVTPLVYWGLHVTKKQSPKNS